MIARTIHRYYEINIRETARRHTRDEGYCMQDFTERFDEIEDMQEFLIDRYGKIPNGRKKIYIDLPDGEVAVIGFLHSYWNRDWSHSDDTSWLQTDWIAIYSVEKTTAPAALKEVLA